jgi:hypothetical protein
MFVKLIAAALACALLTAPASAQQRPATPPPTASTPLPNDYVLLTIFLKHDETRPLGELNAQLDKQGYYKAFPPAGVEVVSWYVMMGIGQVVTLKVPPSRLRDVNRAIEQTAWGSYHTEFYATYDYKQIAEERRKQAQ